MPSNPAVQAAIAQLVDSINLNTNAVDLITYAALDAIDGADYSSITVVNNDGSLATLGPTDDITVRLDEMQAELREGPCYDAAVADSTFVAKDLVNDERWPRYGPAAARMGIKAQMGVALHRRDGRAALNLYAKRRWSFEDAAETAELFASHASVMLGYVELTNHFEHALSSRGTIGQAIGIIMERYQVNEDKAFEFLLRISSTSQVKLREVAADIVAGLNRRNPP